MLKSFHPLIFLFLNFLSANLANPNGQAAQPNLMAWNSLFHGRGDISTLWPIDEEAEIDAEFGGGEFPPIRLQRNALRPNAKNRWTGYRDWQTLHYIIPYEIVDQFMPMDERRIMEAMAGVAKNSCVRFRRRRDEVDYLQIRNERGQGCYSTTVGRLLGSGNIINLETNESIQCASQLGLILHELFHVIGLWHEHQRADRHKFIRIHRTHVLPGLRFQLIKAPRDQVTRYGVRYDYRSVMHYPKDGFALFPGLIVLQTLRPHFQDIIGHASNASPNDYLKICAIYNCHRCMGRHFRRGRNTRARGEFQVQPAMEEDIWRQQRELEGRRRGRGYGQMDGGQNGWNECQCQWRGCYCRIDPNRWEWRPFGQGN